MVFYTNKEGFLLIMCIRKNDGLSKGITCSFITKNDPMSIMKDVNGTT